ncbi:MAG: metal ABC transporter substrate-binding protein [Thermomicrobium sp.]|nr:metal ABC transporter substrate-binding protein [Thermomicrobium sp.]
MQRRFVTLMLVLGFVGTACAAPVTPTPSPVPAAATPAGARLVVVTSLPIFSSLVEAVGGELVDTSAVLPPGVDPHTYQPTPRDVARLAEAQLVVYNGGGLDPWMERQLEAVHFRGNVVVLAEGLEPPPGVTEEEEHAEGTPAGDHEQETPTRGAESDHGHVHGVNPHFWLDPDFAIVYVERIASGLSNADPTHAETYRANAARYIDEIRSFDAWAKEQIATIPPERRKLVTFHDAFPYFAAHFGLELVGVVVVSPGREPSPQEVARLVERIRTEGVPAIFVEPQFNPKLAQTIAQEAGARVFELYSDAAPAGTDYLGMMRQNVLNVVEGLRG